MANPEKVDATTVVRDALQKQLNHAVARVEGAKKELRSATAEERRLRAELHRNGG